MSATETAPIGFRAALRPVAALLIGTGLLYLGAGLHTTLVPLRADAEGFGSLAIGFLGATYYAGFVVGCLVVPYVILRAGHIRAFAALVSSVSAAALAYPLLIGEFEWVFFRFAFGFCFSGILVVVESWLNEKATNASRGTVMSTYVIITYLALTIGQLGVTALPIVGFALFSLCSIVLSLAAVPVALTRASQPAPIPIVRFRPLRTYRLAPAGVVGTFVAGLMTGSLFSLGAIYAIDSGFNETEAAFFVSAVVLGGAIGQYPFGRASDFVDRRIVMLIAVAAAAAISLFLVLADVLNDWLIMGLGLAFGLVMLPIYSLAAAHSYDWTPHEDMVETSVALILVFGIGSTIGPLIAASAMALFGPGGLFLVTAASAGALAAFVGVRIAARRRPSDEMRSDFDIYSTAPVGGAVAPDPVIEDEPLMEDPTRLPTVDPLTRTAATGGGATGAMADPATATLETSGGTRDMER